MSGNRSVDDEFLSRPVLVYGPRKAGTTLLQNLLDGGSSLLMLPGELKLKTFVRKPIQAQADPARLFAIEGRSFFPALFDVDADNGTIHVKEIQKLVGLSNDQLAEIFDVSHYAKRLSEILNGNLMDLGGIIKADTSAFVEALRHGRGTATRWASKEVGSDPNKVLDLFRKHFPQGQIVYAIRQPEFIVRSIAMDRRRKGRRMSSRAIIHECVSAQKVINNGYECLVGGDVVVAYEQLTDNAEVELKRVCKGLHIPYEEILTRPTSLGQSVVVTTSSRQTQQVFRQATRWQENLCWRDVMLIHAFNIFAPLWYSLTGRKWVRYEKLISALDDVKHREAA